MVVAWVVIVNLAVDLSYGFPGPQDPIPLGDLYEPEPDPDRVGLADMTWPRR